MVFLSSVYNVVRPEYPALPDPPRDDTVVKAEEKRPSVANTAPLQMRSLWYRNFGCTYVLSWSHRRSAKRGRVLGCSSSALSVRRFRELEGSLVYVVRLCRIRGTTTEPNLFITTVTSPSRGYIRFSALYFTFLGPKSVSSDAINKI